MHAAAWQENPELRRRLATVCLLADVDLAIVRSGEALLAAGKRSDLLIVDCSWDTPDELERCSRIVENTGLPVDIIHPRLSILEELQSVVHSADQLMWTPPESVGIPLLGTLLALSKQWEAARELAEVLKPGTEPAQRHLVTPDSSLPGTPGDTVDVLSQTYLESVVARANQDLTVLRPAVAREADRRMRPRDRMPALTDEQRAVMHRLARGLTEKEIARRMNRGERTVRTRIAELKSIFGARNKKELGVIARASGFGGPRG